MWETCLQQNFHPFQMVSMVTAREDYMKGFSVLAEKNEANILV